MHEHTVTRPACASNTPTLLRAGSDGRAAKYLPAAGPDVLRLGRLADARAQRNSRHVQGCSGRLQEGLTGLPSAGHRPPRVRVERRIEPPRQFPKGHPTLVVFLNYRSIRMGEPTPPRRWWFQPVFGIAHIMLSGMLSFTMSWLRVVSLVVTTATVDATRVMAIRRPRNGTT